MIQVTPEEIIAFVRSRGILELETEKQGKQFTTQFDGNLLIYVPDSTKKPRGHEMKWLRPICKRFSEDNSYRPTDYSNLGRNASYTLAVIRTFLAPRLSQHLLGEEIYEKRLAAKIGKSAKDSPDARRERLARAPKTPQIRLATTVIYLRNADVVAEVLSRANGVCEGCEKPAPFPRKTDGTPYLEVHHRKRLRDGGDDTVENAVALCPNCHRKEHHGQPNMRANGQIKTSTQAHEAGAARSSSESGASLVR